MPSATTLQAMRRKTTADFRFTVKTHRSLTHDILQGRGIVDAPERFEEFRAGLRPLLDSGQLGGVLAQFPMRFTNRPECRDYLDRAIDRLGDLGLIVEFRHASWRTDETLAHLRRRGVASCVVDEPPLPDLMPWTGDVTADTAYVRLHGRPAAQWFGTSVAERYDYLCGEPELVELADKVEDLSRRARRVLIFFNNCHAGAAARNARQFRELLIARGLLAKAPPAALF